MSDSSSNSEQEHIATDETVAEQTQADISGATDASHTHASASDEDKKRGDGGSAAESTAGSEAAAAESTAAAEAGAGSAGISEKPPVAEEIAELTTHISQLQEENSRMKDQLLRTQADFQNTRRRIEREKQDAVQFANQQLLLDLVTIIDDFERAIKSAGESKDFDAFHDGIVMIEKQFTGMLERKWGLKRYESAGEPFDPERHEAVAVDSETDHEESVVLDVYQNGYLLHDRVLRSAKVKVAMPTSGSASS